MKFIRNLRNLYITYQKTLFFKISYTIDVRLIWHFYYHPSCYALELFVADSPMFP